MIFFRSFSNGEFTKKKSACELSSWPNSCGNQSGYRIQPPTWLMGDHDFGGSIIDQVPFQDLSKCIFWSLDMIFFAHVITVIERLQH